MVSNLSKFDDHIYHGYSVLQKYLPFIIYCEVCTCKVNCLQTFQHISTHWAIKVYVSVKSHIHI